MGNIITFGEGNNYKIDGNDNIVHTPLNAWIQKVMNEDYFFSPNLNDNMINTINTEVGGKERRDENKHVLLKRALCTGQSHIPIAFPYVQIYEANGEYEVGNIDYKDGQTIKIHVTDKSEFEFPLMEQTETLGSRQDALKKDLYNNIDTNEKIITIKQKITNGENLEDEERFLAYLWQMKKTNENTSFNPPKSDGTQDGGYYIENNTGDGQSPMFNGSKKCGAFYRGSGEGEINYRQITGNKAANKQHNGFNTFDQSGKSISTAFCGKLLQYEQITSSKQDNDGNKHYLSTRIVNKNDGDWYRQNNFEDCACINSTTAQYHQDLSEYMNEATELMRVKGKCDSPDKNKEICDAMEKFISQTPKYSQQSYAQMNDSECSSLLSFGQNQTAFVESNKTLSQDINMCFSNVVNTNVDIADGSSLESGAKCPGASDEDNERIKKCLVGELEFCGKEEKEKMEKEEKLKMWVIITIVVVVIVLFGLIGYIIYTLNKRRGTSTSNVEIKYSKPISDPLFR